MKTTFRVVTESLPEAVTLEVFRETSAVSSDLLVKLSVKRSLLETLFPPSREKIIVQNAPVSIGQLSDAIKEAVRMLNDTRPTGFVEVGKMPDGTPILKNTAGPATAYCGNDENPAQPVAREPLRESYVDQGDPDKRRQRKTYTRGAAHSKEAWKEIFDDYVTSGKDLAAFAKDLGSDILGKPYTKARLYTAFFKEFYVEFTRHQQSLKKK